MTGNSSERSVHTEVVLGSIFVAPLIGIMLPANLTDYDDRNSTALHFDFGRNVRSTGIPFSRASDTSAGTPARTEQAQVAELAGHRTLSSDYAVLAAGPHPVGNEARDLLVRWREYIFPYELRAHTTEEAWESATAQYFAPSISNDQLIADALGAREDLSASYQTEDGLRVFEFYMARGRVTCVIGPTYYHLMSFSEARSEFADEFIDADAATRLRVMRCLEEMLGRVAR